MYVYRKPASVRVRLPRRPWNRGLGQQTDAVSAQMEEGFLGDTNNPTCPGCGPLTADLCALGLFTSVYDWTQGCETPCSQCAVQAPGGVPGTEITGTVATVPVGYSAATGTVDPSNTTGQTQNVPYGLVYPNVPGTNPATNCDWTQASWLDPTTWCMANWALAAAAVVGLTLFLTPKGVWR